jgi:hypothetical protein
MTLKAASNLLSLDDQPVSPATIVVVLETAVGDLETGVLLHLQNMAVLNDVRVLECKMQSCATAKGRADENEKYSTGYGTRCGRRSRRFRLCSNDGWK